MNKPKIWTIKMPNNTLSKWVKHEDYIDLLAEAARLKIYVDQLEGHIALIQSLGNDMAKKMPPCVALHNWVSVTGGTKE